MWVTVGSIKGSPGATSVALGLTARWPRGKAVLIEADSDGGDLAARFGVHPQPGLTDLVLTARAGGPDTIDLSAYTRRLPLGVDAVMAPPGAAAAAAVEQLAELVPALRRASADRPVLVDVGRLMRPASVQPLLEAADHVVVVAAPRFTDLTQVQTQLARLRAATHAQVWLMMSGAGPITDTEASSALQLPVLANLGRDRAGATYLNGYYRLNRLWQRLTIRAVDTAARRLDTTGQPLAAPDAAQEATTR